MFSSTKHQTEIARLTEELEQARQAIKEIETLKRDLQFARLTGEKSQEEKRIEKKLEPARKLLDAVGEPIFAGIIRSYFDGTNEGLETLKTKLAASREDLFAAKSRIHDLKAELNLGRQRQKAYEEMVAHWQCLQAGQKKLITDNAALKEQVEELQFQLETKIRKTKEK